MLTLRQLSTKSSVALGYISEVERGQKEGSSEILECLAKALDYDLCDLVILAGWRMKMRATEFDKKFLLDLELQNK
jgi:transcriptional regulator with XRE-family HTH domain